MSGTSFDPAHDSFDDIYRSVGDDLERVPWAGLLKTSFVESRTPAGSRQFVATYHRPERGTAAG